MSGRVWRLLRLRASRFAQDDGKGGATGMRVLQLRAVRFGEMTLPGWLSLCFPPTRGRTAREWGTRRAKFGGPSPSTSLRVRMTARGTRRGRRSEVLQSGYGDDENDPRYPIGKYSAPATIGAEDLRYAMATLAELPEALREAVRPLDQDQINTPYREGGWTVRQLVHHVGDSHMVALHRVKMALCVDWPEAQGYPEGSFALLHDVTAPVEWTLQLLEGVHARWVMLLQSLTEEQWERGVVHSERGRQTISSLTMLYAWHSRHHVAHVTHMRKERGW